MEQAEKDLIVPYVLVFWFLVMDLYIFFGSVNENLCFWS